MKKHFLILLIFIATSISAQANSPCDSGSLLIIQPFIGTWQEFTVEDGKETFLGTLHSKLNKNECVLQQYFLSTDSSFSYRTFGYMEPSANIWQETYVFSTGGNSKYHWIVDGEDVLQRRIGGTRPLDYMHQLRLTNIQKNSYEAIEEHSHDGGKTWEQKGLTRIKRVSNVNTLRNSGNR